MTVNMGKDPEELYLDITSLLQDICKFLSADKLKLSSAEKKIAEALITRSKEQLQEISKISVKLPNVNEEYVDMSKKIDLPATQASDEVKSGYLLMKRKFFNLIGRSTRVFAALHEHWLLIYWSNKETKPFCALDLKHYKAKEDRIDLKSAEFENRDNGFDKNSKIKLALSFKIFNSKSPDKKYYHFRATTHKDMIQWVVNINQNHDKALWVKDEGNYDVIDTAPADEEENIYNEPETLGTRSKCVSKSPTPSPLKSEKDDERPPLPEKRPLETVLTPVPCGPSLSASTESLASYHQIEGPKISSKSCSIKSVDDSFADISEDDEDQTYYELDNIIKDIDSNVKKRCQEGNKVDQAPPLLPKPRKVPQEEDDEDEMYENNCLQPPLEKNNCNADNLISEGFLQCNELKITLPKPLNKELSPSSPFELKQPNAVKNFDFVLEASASQKPITAFHQKQPEKSPNILKIVRRQSPNAENRQSCNLETFSPSKIETFQASPSKDSLLTNLTKSSSDSSTSMNSLSLSKKPNIKNNNKPKVSPKPPSAFWTKPNKKLFANINKNEKSPTATVKPGKCSKNIGF